MCKLFNTYQMKQLLLDLYSEYPVVSTLDKAWWNLLATSKSCVFTYSEIKYNSQLSVQTFWNWIWQTINKWHGDQSLCKPWYHQYSIYTSWIKMINDANKTSSWQRNYHPTLSKQILGFCHTHGKLNKCTEDSN